MITISFCFIDYYFIYLAFIIFRALVYCGIDDENASHVTCIMHEVSGHNGEECKGRKWGSEHSSIE